MAWTGSDTWEMILAHKVSANVEARIWAASYDPKRDAFRVALEDRQVFLLQRPIPEDDHSEVLDTFLGGVSSGKNK